jgi:hypothetical protein
MALERPKAVITVHGGASVVLTSATGIYQSQAQFLDLFGNVNLVHENGTRFVTQRAHLNLSDNTAEGHDPVEGHGPSGDITGEGFRTLSKGETITFTGKSHLLFKGAKPSSTPAQPPVLPTVIEKKAARIEAAAAAMPVALPAPPAPSASPTRPTGGKPSVTPRAAKLPPSNKYPAATAKSSKATTTKVKHHGG